MDTWVLAKEYIWYSPNFSLEQLCKIIDIDEGVYRAEPAAIAVHHLFQNIKEIRKDGLKAKRTGKKVFDWRKVK